MCDIDLPDLIELSDFGGDWNSYFDAVYEVFRNDFIYSSVEFRGVKLGLKRHPLIDDKEYTFYHFTTSGSIETNRIADISRCERIPWAKPTIENCDSWALKVWEQKRKGETRICIWLELEDEPDYFIVLNKRKGYLIPWSAFVIKYDHERRKKQREYEQSLKS